MFNWPKLYQISYTESSYRNVPIVPNNEETRRKSQEFEDNLNRIGMMISSLFTSNIILFRFLIKKLDPDASHA